jgi:hypothetical protein
LEIAKKGGLKHTFEQIKNDTWKVDGCSACNEAKATRLPKKDESPKGSRPGEYIHSDIAGPQEESFSGNQYIITFFDDYSKINRVVLSPNKENVLKYMKEFITLLERQLDVKVRFIRTDGGLEYASIEAIKWYTLKGIIHQVSPRYTPELNGVAERFNRTLKEMASSMLFSAKIVNGFWDFAVRYASTTLNKISYSKDGVNAWHALTGREPGLQKQFCFGQEVYVQVPQPILEPSILRSGIISSGIGLRIRR